MRLLSYVPEIFGSLCTGTDFDMTDAPAPAPAPAPVAGSRIVVVNRPERWLPALLLGSLQGGY